LSLVIVIALGASLFLTSTAFGIRDIVVVGSVRLTSPEIVELTGVELGTNLLKIPTGKVRDRLLACPVIAEATVSRKFPSSLIIRVSERHGVALLPASGRFLELDSSGLCIAEHQYVSALGLPLVSGIVLEELAPGTRPADERLAGVLLCADALGVAGRLQVAEIHIGDAGELLLYTREGTPVYLGPPDDLEDKIVALLGILLDLEESGIEATYIDVRYPRYPVVGSPDAPAPPQGWIDPDIYVIFGEP